MSESTGCNLGSRPMLQRLLQCGLLLTAVVVWTSHTASEICQNTAVVGFDTLHFLHAAREAAWHHDADQQRK